MPKQKLIAVKSFTYMTRHLTAGASFEAKPRDARVLKAIGKARDDYDAPVKEALEKPVAPVAPPPAAPVAAPAPTPIVSAQEEHAHDPLDALRAEAATLGLHVDRRWGEARLMQEIDDAREKAAKDHATAPESPETAPPVAMTTDSASALLMPRPWPRDEE
jgi:hypothetical protein